MYAEGSVLAGKYRIERVLGAGGMGIVLGAKHLHLGVPVALKVMQDTSDAGRIERFLREARACAQLRTENVCRVSDVGVLDDGSPYIVMEMLVGDDLQALLANQGPLPVATACDCILQACIALAEAHAGGIVHRDLKPGNLFWTQRPDGSRLIKVLDFGIAKSTQADFVLTQNAVVFGSLGYMSPEQLKSTKDVDVRTDIWALGIVLYELVSGRIPFAADSITKLAEIVGTEPMPPLVGIGPLENVIARCLAKNPDDRFQDVSELASALAPFAGKQGAALANVITRTLAGGQFAVVHTVELTVAPTPTTPLTQDAPASTPSRTWWHVPVVAGLIAAAVAAAVIVVAGQGGSESAAMATDTSAEIKPEQTMPAREEAKPIVETARPTPEEVKPTAVEAKPTVDETKPTVDETKPIPEEVKPTTLEAKPVVEPNVVDAHTRKTTKSKTKSKHTQATTSRPKTTTSTPKTTATTKTTTTETTTSTKSKPTLEQASESRR